MNQWKGKTFGIQGEDKICVKLLSKFIELDQLIKFCLALVKVVINSRQGRKCQHKKTDNITEAGIFAQ